ncbi:hypothetical protein GGX14DRAFT_332466, partial [Mycena pura]
SMVNRRISKDLKLCVLRPWEVGWAVGDICWALCVSPSSLYRWRAVMAEWGIPVKPRSPLEGRERLVSLAMLTATKDIFSNEPTVMLHLVLFHNLPISLSALQATLNRAGLT